MRLLTISLSHWQVCIFLILPRLIMAQEDYAVLRTVDTLRGEVVISSYTSGGADEISLRTDEGRQMYNALEVVAFRTGGKIYETIKYQDRYQYMEKYLDGYLSIYYYRPESSNVFSMMLLRKAGGEQMEVPVITYRKRTAEFLEDCDDIAEKVENGDYPRKNIEILVNDYNACVRERTENMLGKSDPELDQLTDRFLKAITTAEIDGDKTELRQLVNDIRIRLKNEDPIPGYLRSALKSMTDGNRELADLAAQLLDFKK